MDQLRLARSLPLLAQIKSPATTAALHHACLFSSATSARTSHVCPRQHALMALHRHALAPLLPTLLPSHPLKATSPSAPMLVFRISTTATPPQLPRASFPIPGSSHLVERVPADPASSHLPMPIHIPQNSGTFQFSAKMTGFRSPRTLYVISHAWFQEVWIVARRSH